MKFLKEKNFEVYSFLDNLKGNNAGEIIDNLVKTVPKIKGINFAGYKTKKLLTKTLDIFILDKERNHDLFKVDGEDVEIFNLIKETMQKLKLYFNSKKYIFVFPTFDTFTVEIMNGVGGFLPKKSVIFLFLNLNGKDWKSSLKDTLVHEFAHSVSDFYSGGKNFNLGEGMIFDGLAENFRKINFGGNDLLIKAVSREECLKYFEELKSKLDSTDFDFYMEVFYGTGKYPRWLGYSLGYYLIEKYLSTLNDLDWNIILRKNPKEILNILLNKSNKKNNDNNL